MIKHYYQNECSLERALRPFYGTRDGASKSTLQRLVAKFETTGSVNIHQHPTKERQIGREHFRGPWKCAGEPEAINSSPCTSTRPFADFNLANSASGLLAYIRTRSNWPRSSKLMTIDNAVFFADWASEHLEEDPNFGRKSSLATRRIFWMNGYVKKHNCPIRDHANPHEVHQVTMHPQNVTVWCGFWAGGIIGPYFFLKRRLWGHQR